MTHLIQQQEYPVPQWLLDGLNTPLKFRLIMGFYTIALALLTTYLLMNFNGYLLLSAAAGVAWIGMAEYLIHRYWMHGNVQSKFFVARSFARIHILHHNHPENVAYTSLPVISSLILLAVFVAPLWMLTSDTLVILAYVSGLILGYLLHENIHYLSHHNRKWLTRLTNYHVRYHMIHHYYQRESGNYVMIFPFIDKLFGTQVGKIKRLNEVS